ncbi:MAG: hypothetical protein KAI06_10600, partial [Anaerolineales bacterium]|nr:hypothetical protein [Anaerolineales bacterium]
MMKIFLRFMIIPALIVVGFALTSCSGQSAPPSEDGALSTADLSEEAKECVECHATETTGISADWDSSAHADEAISCIDCHEVEADSLFALDNVEGHEDLTVTVSMLVPPAVCSECHEDQVTQFYASGHYRSGLQVIAKDSMQTLMYIHEGRDHPELSGAPNQTGCSQCHGIEFELDENGRPIAATYPTSGIGNI